MPNRNRRPQYDDYQADYNERFSRQSEQFRSDERYQPGDSDYRYRRNGRDYDQRSERDYDRQPQQYDNSHYRDDYDPLGDYDRASYVSRTSVYETPRSQSHASFRADDYGGEDYTRSPRRYRGTRGAGSGGYRSMNYSGSDMDFDRGYGRDRNDERDFFDKAGDEIASWFGDEDAERRRRMDHRGRGPANYERSNERLLEDACERLTHDRRVDASNINVTADNNEITLDGTVDSRMAKRRAEDCVHDISGVKHVQNNLRIADRDDEYRTSDDQAASRSKQTS